MLHLRFAGRAVGPSAAKKQGDWTILFPILLANTPERDILIASLWLVGLILVATVVIVWLRRRLQRDQGVGGSGMDVGSIEQMHRSGLISDEEFRKLRRSALGLADEQDGPGEGKSASSDRPAGDDTRSDDAAEADESSARQQRRDERQT